VRRERLALAERRDAQLRAGASELRARDALFDDPTAFGELRQVGVVRCALQFVAHRTHACNDSGGFVRLSRRRQPLEIDQRVAFTRYAFVELHDQLPQ
jgi:hypothetical protein